MNEIHQVFDMHVCQRRVGLMGLHNNVPEREPLYRPQLDRQESSRHDQGRSHGLTLAMNVSEA